MSSKTEPCITIVMTVFESWDLLPRAVACVMQQDYPHWELILAVDGPAPTQEYSPRQMVHQLHRLLPKKRVELLELPRSPGCWGNVGRHEALRHARGDYVCWVNHDNLITARYLSAHVENIREAAGPCVSVVDIEWWQNDRYRGRLPQAWRSGKIDLLCYAIPLTTAREICAFGPEMQTVYAADWLVFDRSRSRLPVIQNQIVVGTHF